MSPFLYILMEETLSRKLSSDMEEGYILGIMISRGVHPINNALFVNDSLLLGGSSMKIVRAFNEILQKYCQISGAMVNKKKCSLWLEC